MTEQVPEIPISKFKQLNPFDEGDGGEEKGNVLAPDSLAGGGRAFVGTHKSELNVSRAIKKRLVQLGEIGEADAKIDSDEVRTDEKMKSTLTDGTVNKIGFKQKVIAPKPLCPEDRAFKLEKLDEEAELNFVLLFVFDILA